MERRATLALKNNISFFYPNACCVMKAPPANMNIASFSARVMRSLLNKVIVLDIILSLRQVRKIPINPNMPTEQTTIPDKINLILSKVVSFSIVLPQMAHFSASVQLWLE